MGPAVGILLRERITETLKSVVVEKVRNISDSMSGENFWVEGSPFIYSFGWEYENEEDEYAGLANVAGWAPKDQLILAAMCNQPDDYHHLGNLCVEFSQLLDGLVEFGVPLSDYTSDEGLLNDPNHFVYEKMSWLGPSLMKKWRNHKDFWLVK